MRAALWMVAGSLGSALVAIGIGGRSAAVEILTGMAAPLAAAAVSWVAIERTYRRDPVRLTAVTTAGFAAKAVFFGAYVAVMLKAFGMRPVPFVASFTAYFIALYLTEALLMRQMFVSDLKRQP